MGKIIFVTYRKFNSLCKILFIRIAFIWHVDFYQYPAAFQVPSGITTLHTRKCEYEGVRNATFSENFAYVLNG